MHKLAIGKLTICQTPKLNTNAIRKPYGFTFVEIMVVILIIAIVTSFALLAVGDFGQSRRAASAARQFKTLLKLAQYQAILEPSVLGLKITKQGYRFYRYQQHADSKWQPLHDRVWRSRKWPPNSKYHLSIKDPSADDNNSLPILIFPDGNMTPFILRLFSESAAYSTLIESKQDGDVTLEETP